MLLGKALSEIVCVFEFGIVPQFGVVSLLQVVYYCLPFAGAPHFLYRLEEAVETRTMLLYSFPTVLQRRKYCTVLGDVLRHVLGLVVAVTPEWLLTGRCTPLRSFPRD